jgi:hypothetical protein
MSGDGLWYMPEGFREGARANTTASDAAAATEGTLRGVQVNAASYGGADAFVNALIETRDVQARGVAMAAEGRQNMATADNNVADIGIEVDSAAAQAMGSAAAAFTQIQPDQGIADGL